MRGRPGNPLRHSRTASHNVAPARCSGTSRRSRRFGRGARADLVAQTAERGPSRRAAAGRNLAAAVAAGRNLAAAVAAGRNLAAAVAAGRNLAAAGHNPAAAGHNPAAAGHNPAAAGHNPAAAVAENSRAVAAAHGHIPQSPSPQKLSPIRQLTSSSYSLNRSASLHQFERVQRPAQRGPASESLQQRKPTS